MSTPSTTPLPHLLLIGATGRTGQHVLNQALTRGHTVTALIRPGSTISTSHPNLTIHTGSPLSSSDISAALSNINTPVVIISTLGQKRQTGSPFSKPITPPTMMADSALAVTNAMQQHPHAKKLVLMSMFGVDTSFKNLNCVFRSLFLYSNMRATLDDHNAVYKVLRASRVTFVAPRAAMLMGEESKAVRVWGEEGRGVGWFPSVSARSVAEFLLDASVSGEWDGRSDVITD